MADILDYLSDAHLGFRGVGAFVAAVLVVALYVVMPRGSRRHVRLPASLLVLYLVAAALGELLPLSDEAGRAFDVVGLFFLLSCLGRASFVLVVDGLLDYRLGRPLPRIVREIVQLLVYFGVAFLTLRAMGAELGSLLTTSALLTAVVGLSLQDTLGNVFAGLAIQAQRPFKVGDWIQVDGTAETSIGQVIEINWRATKILTNDHVEIVIPNGLLAKSPITNFTQPTEASRRIVKIQGPYDKPPHLVEAALLETTCHCPGVLSHPPPTTWVSLYADSGIEYSVVYFIDDFAKRPVIDSNVRRRLWYALQRVGVSIPFPVRDVRVQQQTDHQTDEARANRSRELQRTLRSVDFLDVLPESGLAQLASAAETRLYASGEDIIRQGEEGAELFIIRSGRAVVLLQAPGREPTEIAQLQAGAVVGEMSLVTGEPRSATVRAVTACECVAVGHLAFGEVLATNLDLAERISDVLASRRAEIDSTRVAQEAYDRASESNVLLKRIKNFFSLWPPDGSSSK